MCTVRPAAVYKQNTTGKPRKFYAALDSGRVAQEGTDDAARSGRSLLRESINKLMSLEDFMSLEHLAVSVLVTCAYLSLSVLGIYTRVKVLLVYFITLSGYV